MMTSRRRIHFTPNAARALAKVARRAGNESLATSLEANVNRDTLIDRIVEADTPLRRSTLDAASDEELRALAEAAGISVELPADNARRSGNGSGYLARSDSWKGDGIFRRQAPSKIRRMGLEAAAEKNARELCALDSRDRLERLGQQRRVIRGKIGDGLFARARRTS